MTSLYKQSYHHILFLFFFQAEDGIRDGHVTGVQTCALPIYFGSLDSIVKAAKAGVKTGGLSPKRAATIIDVEATLYKTLERSEERRVGKESRSRSRRLYKKKRMKRHFQPLIIKQKIKRELLC